MLYRGYEIREVSNGFIAVGEVNTLGGEQGEFLSVEHAKEGIDNFLSNPQYGYHRDGLN